MSEMSNGSLRERLNGMLSGKSEIKQMMERVEDRIGEEHDMVKSTSSPDGGFEWKYLIGDMEINFVVSNNLDGIAVVINSNADTTNTTGQYIEDEIVNAINNKNIMCSYLWDGKNNDSKRCD